MEPGLKKEETFYFLLEQLFHECAVPLNQVLAPEPNKEIQSLCTYIEQHFSENLTLDQLADMGGFADQSHFTNFFKEFTGLTPRPYQRILTDPGGEKDNGSKKRK